MCEYQISLVGPLATGDPFWAMGGVTLREARLSPCVNALLHIVNAGFLP